MRTRTGRVVVTRASGRIRRARVQRLVVQGQRTAR
jgi:hypothetical protein